METGKTFVITGITGGLGLALAEELLQRGHSVHGCGRREDPLAGKERANYDFRQLDVTDLEGVRDWASSLEDQRIDYLVHNAAVIHRNAPLWEIDGNELEAVVKVNISGSFNVLQAFLPAMVRRRHGILITLSSGAGRAGLPRIAGYCASKWAVEGMMKSLARELPEGMAAIPLSPGIVDTRMLRSSFGEAAGDHQKPVAWAKVAADYILGINTGQNGESLTVPDSSRP